MHGSVAWILSLRQKRANDNFKAEDDVRVMSSERGMCITED